ncbi:failed axon connections homolog [Mizuhopecten yessoensis]|uniref:Failed axon connections-like n=1 Tax=Mizuhopecten yessoensis TaxID=6573 RepID=A0A210PTV0_MIZYE|nr:failed axon connections homolog [Mizuhopecten yessoensis]OWF39913.1 Failed axon connections-like [Mizuhopecten yessoensis]
MALSKVTDTIVDLPLGVKALGGVVLTGVVLAGFWKGLGVRQTNRKVYPPNTIVIHQLGRGPYVPSLTPFAIKLETYFRLEGIPYQAEHALYRKSQKTGKVPFLEYNGEEVSDSEFILEFLSKEKNFDMHKGLTAEQIGVGRAFQKMAEENTYWCFVADRWVLDKNNTALKEFGIPRYLWGRMQGKIRTMIHAQGLGRHTPEEIRHIMSNDLTALSYFIGSKKFLFGDEACKFDCAIFGILAEIRWASFGGFGTSVIKQYPNLCDYCERMKKTFWPDWEEMIKRDCTK